MPKVTILKGLQASGKSTYAKMRALENNVKRVNKDDLRAMLDNSVWNKPNEKFVLKVRDYIIKAALEDGFDVIVDDTNLQAKHEGTIRELAIGHDVSIKWFRTGLSECIRRDKLRPNSVGSKIIYSTYEQNMSVLNENGVSDDGYTESPKNIYTPPEDKPEAILVDIDGTLAHGGFGEPGKRRPYDWARVGEDIVDPVVADIVRMYSAEDTKVIVMSGRDSVCRAETEQWLKDNDIPYDELFMRDEKDQRKDDIVKKEIFRRRIQDNYDVWFVLDDRKQVVRMWQSMGLKVLCCLDDIDADF